MDANSELLPPHQLLEETSLVEAHFEAVFTLTQCFAIVSLKKLVAGWFFYTPAGTLTPAEPRDAPWLRPLGEALLVQVLLLDQFLWFSAELKFSVDLDEVLA